MKHIEIHHHLVQKKSFEDFIKLAYYNTKNMFVDILIKGLFVNKYEYC